MNLRTHLGGLHGKTSYDAAKDNAEMEVSAVGVVIKTLNGRPIVRDGKIVHLVVPYPNTTEIIIEAEEAEDEKPRGPGRPPGPKAA